MHVKKKVVNYCTKEDAGRARNEHNITQVLEIGQWKTQPPASSLTFCT